MIFFDKVKAMNLPTKRLLYRSVSKELTLAEYKEPDKFVVSGQMSRFLEKHELGKEPIYRSELVELERVLKKAL
jgi:hypothetical protein